MSTTEITAALAANGLTEKEARTYVAMLGLGSTTPYQISKRSGLKTPITYVILETLLKKGLVLKTPFKTGWRFQAKKINDFLTEREYATHTLSGVSGLINSLIQGRPASSILFFQGYAEIETALRYKLKDTKQFCAFYGSAAHISPNLKSIFIAWYTNLQRHGIVQKSIAPLDPSLNEFRSMDAAHGNETKQVSSQIYDSESSIEIHDSFVRIVMLATETCLIIEDENLPKVLRQVFEMVWRMV